MSKLRTLLENKYRNQIETKWKEKKVKDHSIEIDTDVAVVAAAWAAASAAAARESNVKMAEKCGSAVEAAEAAAVTAAMFVSISFEPQFDSMTNF